MKKIKSGFVTIIGKPNVGKSTLLNRLVGSKIAIVSNKPQTTRNKILSIYTDEECQIIFIDTPGIHKPKNKLGEYMVKASERTLSEVDLVLMIVEPVNRAFEMDKIIIEKLKTIQTPVVLLINKIDTVKKEEVLKIIEAYRGLYEFAEIVPISAQEGDNVPELVASIKARMQYGPQYYPDDFITDQPERQIVSEIVREKTLMLLEDEIPHGIAVEVSSMKKRDDRDLVDIEATIFCERESHKGIVIGKQGAKLKEIGQKARIEIQNLLGSQINLQLWVKVKKDWRDSDFLLKSFGYDQKKL